VEDRSIDGLGGVTVGVHFSDLSCSPLLYMRKGDRFGHVVLITVTVTVEDVVIAGADLTLTVTEMELTITRLVQGAGAYMVSQARKRSPSMVKCLRCSVLLVKGR